MIIIKRSLNLLSIILCAIIAYLIAYFVLESIILSLIFSLISGLFLSMINKENKRKENEKKQYKNICEFVYLINTKMLETDDVFEAYSLIENQLAVDFINITKQDFYQQLDEIASNYHSESFKMYVNDLKIYKENDVNFHLLVDTSTKHCFNEKKDNNILIKKKYAYLTQINYLYVLWITLLVFIKISVTDYYALMMSSFIYQLLLFIVLLIGLIFYYFAYKEYLK